MGQPVSDSVISRKRRVQGEKNQRELQALSTESTDKLNPYNHFVAYNKNLFHLFTVLLLGQAQQGQFSELQKRWTKAGIPGKPKILDGLINLNAG